MEESTFADMVDLFFGPGQEVRDCLCSIVRRSCRLRIHVEPVRRLRWGSCSVLDHHVSEQKFCSARFMSALTAAWADESCRYLQAQPEPVLPAPAQVAQAQPQMYAAHQQQPSPTQHQVQTQPQQQQPQQQQAGQMQRSLSSGTQQRLQQQLQQQQAALKNAQHNPVRVVLPGHAAALSAGDWLSSACLLVRLPLEFIDRLCSCSFLHFPFPKYTYPFLVLLRLKASNSCLNDICGAQAMKMATGQAADAYWRLLGEMKRRYMGDLRALEAVVEQYKKPPLSAVRTATVTLQDPAVPVAITQVQLQSPTGLHGRCSRRRRKNCR